MPPRISLRGVLNKSELHEFVDRRIAFALARFASRVRGVSLTVTDENAERGGIDTLCRIVAKLDGSTTIVLEQTDSDPFAAVATACDRARRAVSRELKRARPSKPGRRNRISASNIR